MPPIRRVTALVPIPEPFRIAGYLHDPTKCPICGTKPGRHIDLDRHMLIHALNKEQLKTKCPHCVTRILQPSNLKNHMRRHYRDEEYICGEAIFTKENPHVAVACSFKDIEMRGITRHKQNIHGFSSSGVIPTSRRTRRVQRKVKKVDLDDARDFPTAASRRGLPLPIYDIPASALKKPLPYTIPDNLPEGVVLDGQQVPNVTLDAEAPVIPAPDVVFGTAPNSPVQSDAGSDIDSVLSSGSIDDILALDCPWSQPSTPLDAELEPAYTGAAMNAKLAVSLDSSDYGLFSPQYQQDNVFDFSYGQGVASYPTGDYIVASGSTLPNQVAVNHPISLPHTPVIPDLASPPIDWHTFMADLDPYSDITSSPASSAAASFESDASFFNSDYTNFPDFTGCTPYTDYTGYSTSYPATNNFSYSF